MLGRRPVAIRISSDVTIVPSLSSVDTTPGRIAIDSGRGQAEAHIHTDLSECLRDEFTGEGLLPVEQRAAGHQSDLGAERRPGGGEFGAGDAATDHEQPRRNARGAGRFACAPGLRFRQPRHIREHRDRSGRDRDGFRRVGATVDVDRARTADAGMAADQVDSGRVQPRDLVVVFPVAGERIPAGEDGRGRRAIRSPPVGRRRRVPRRGGRGRCAGALSRACRPSRSIRRRRVRIRRWRHGCRVWSRSRPHSHRRRRPR